MLAPILALLGRWGLSERAAKVAAPFVAALAVLVILTALWGSWQVFDYFNDRAAVKQDRIEANNKAMKAQLEAAETAARERLRNARTNDEEVEAYTDAIYNPQPGDSADPGVRLACEQLRRDGQDTTAIPECGGR